MTGAALVGAEVAGTDCRGDVGNAGPIGDQVVGAEGDEAVCKLVGLVVIGKLVGKMVKGRDVAGARMAAEKNPGENVEGVDPK